MRRLFARFIVRPLLQEKLRTATTVIGVALGIAVVVAIQLTNASSVRGFERALETVAGKTAVEVVSSGAGLDETLLPSLGWLREYGGMSPIIEGSAALVIGDVKTLSRRQLEAVKILGVDILRDQPFRDYQLLEMADDKPEGLSPPVAEGLSPPVGTPPPDSVTTQKFLEILTDERSIVITEKLARRRG